ncbi:MAG: glycosyl transferase [Micavibrio sp.]|nr:MAG: glycosyl transferase [Micavibrio sp.]
MTIPVFVINMPRSTERRKSAEERLKAARLDYHFIEGVDGKALDFDHPHYDRNKRLRYFGRDLLEAEIGCLLSHRKIYQKMIEENIEQALIFEDDVILKEKNFTELLDSIMNSKTSWDIIRFIVPKRSHKIVTQITPEYSLGRVYGTQGGAFGYMITLKAAKKMVEHTERFWLPIDTIHGRTWETGLDVKYLLPCPITTDEEIPSTIGDKRFDKTIQLQNRQKALYPFFRAWHKLNDNIGKRTSYWFS